MQGTLRDSRGTIVTWARFVEGVREKGVGPPGAMFGWQDWLETHTAPVHVQLPGRPLFGHRAGRPGVARTFQPQSTDSLTCTPMFSRFHPVCLPFHTPRLYGQLRVEIHSERRHKAVYRAQSSLNNGDPRTPTSPLTTFHFGFLSFVNKQNKYVSELTDK